KEMNAVPTMHCRVIMNPLNLLRESGNIRQPSLPKLAVQHPILDRLGHVLLPDFLLPRQVGNGPRHLKDAVVGPGAESEGVEGRPEQAAGRIVQGTMAADVQRSHPAVGRVRSPPEPFLLDSPRPVDPLPDRRGTFPRLCGKIGRASSRESWADVLDHVSI